MGDKKPSSNRKLINWTAIGIAVIVLLGGLFHFIFELSGDWTPLGALAPVNESPWEHLKLTFWPAIIFYAATWTFLRNHKQNIIPAAAVSLFVMPAIILGLFYGYTELTGLESLAIDIGIFFISIIGGQYLAYRILRGKSLSRTGTITALIAVLFLAALYAAFTWLPPQADLFRDSASGSYGIPN